MLDGRVKTLHPKVHGGLLFIRSNPEHAAAVQSARHHSDRYGRRQSLRLRCRPLKNPASQFHEIIENIDIGGPSMIRSAAKNFHDVAVVTSPADYDLISAEMEITTVPSHS